MIVTKTNNIGTAFRHVFSEFAIDGGSSILRPLGFSIEYAKDSFVSNTLSIMRV